MRKRVLAGLLAAGFLLVIGCGSSAPERITETTDEYIRGETDIDVKEMGAVGDGVTDDTRAIETAIEAARQQKTRLFFSAGTYVLREDMTFPQDLCIVFGNGARLFSDKRIPIDAAMAAPTYAPVFIGAGTVELNRSPQANPLWFGAVGDGVTDDTEAFEKALQSCRELAIPYTEGGYRITGLKTYRDCCLTGLEKDGKRPVLRATDRTYSLISISDGGLPDGGHATVQNLDFDMADAPDRSTAIYFDTKSGWLYDIYIRHCTFTDAYYTFLDSKTTTTTDNRRAMFYVHIEDVVSQDNRYSTFEIVDFEGYIFFKDLTIDNSASFTKHQLTDGFPMVNLSRLAGNIVQNVTLIGGNSGYENEVGFYYPDGGTSLWFDGIHIRDTGGFGFVLNSYISSISNGTIENCGGGLDASESRELQVNCLTVKGNKGDGIYMEGGENCQFSNVTSCENGGSGLNALKSTVVLTDCIFNDNGQYGCSLFLGGQIINSLCVRNKTKQLRLRGVNDRVAAQRVVVEENGEPKTFTGTKEY